MSTFLSSISFDPVFKMKGCLLFALLFVSAVVSDAKDTKGNIIILGTSSSNITRIMFLACTINDFAFGGGNILVSGSHNLHENWEGCQASCQVK